MSVARSVGKSAGMWSAALSICALTAACTGSVDGGGGPNPPASGNAGNNGTGGAGGTGPGNPSAIDPGRVTVRRLNGAEYDNTIRDLIGLDLKPSKMFEFIEDEWGDGFNNDADVLSLSPISIEKYLSAAQFVITQALDPLPANAAIRSRIVTCTTPATAEAECGKRIVADFAKRAFRRTVQADELPPYLTLIDLAKTNGDTFEAGLKLALASVLMAPDFLFRVEIDPMFGVQRAVTDFELASRLSYFLWASMPDAELIARAEAGVLKTPAEITKQVARMLADPKSSGFTTAMVQQWMHTVSLQFAKPDVTFYPTWQEPLRAAMEEEVRAFLAPVLGGQTPARELLTANYTFANRALGQFYGLPGAANLPVDRFDKVMLTDARRGGVLRQGSFLVLTSHPNTHSPTKRGKWILERLLCRKPPPPPPNIPAFEPTQVQGGTLRQKLEKTHHMMGSICAGCHTFIDPMGFALENYDGAGLWRDKDNGLDIDATGSMPETGVKFNGAAELSAAIAADDRFPACMAKHVLTFALGRHMTDADQPAIDDLGKRFSAGGFKVPALVDLVAQSPLMTRRTAEKD
ncbi:MAG TPA: DUF1592 domain-containing protein [Polyangia bacterium]|nr:DUF1592 domain-containing protein [Polyangia bacterium]